MSRNPDWDIPIEEFKWRVQRTVQVQGEDKGIYVAYPDARTVANHLDRIFGPAGWQDDYHFTPDRDGVICQLKVLIGGEWITKTDVGILTNIESLKGGFSDAFKRAAAKLGVGRNAYEIPEIWGPVNNGKYMPRKDENGRPFAMYLVDQANAKLGKEAPIGDYEAEASDEPPAPKQASKPAQPKIPSDQWATFMDNFKGLSNEAQERVKQWWASSGDGSASPTRNMPADVFEKLSEYTLAELLEQEGLTTGGEAFG